MLSVDFVCIALRRQKADKALELDPSNRVHIDLHSLVQYEPDKHTLGKEKLASIFHYQIYLTSTITRYAQNGVHWLQVVHESNTIYWQNIRQQDTVLSQFHQTLKEVSRLVEILKEVKKFCECKHLTDCIFLKFIILNF